MPYNLWEKSAKRARIRVPRPAPTTSGCIRGGLRLIGPNGMGDSNMLLPCLEVSQPGYELLYPSPSRRVVRPTYSSGSQIIFLRAGSYCCAISLVCTRSAILFGRSHPSSFIRSTRLGLSPIYRHSSGRLVWDREMRSEGLYKI